MASVKMIPEEEATGEVKVIYEEIKSQLGIDFSPDQCARDAPWNRPVPLWCRDD